MTKRRMQVVVLLFAVALVAAGCGDDDRGGGSGPGAPAREGSITVFAAASLTDAFTDLGEAFEAENDGLEVERNFGSSSRLREQILAGAPADVYASADAADMDQLVAAGAAGGASRFATNQLRIVVPAGNAEGVTGLADFATGDLLIGLCAQEVPCGRFARQALAKAGVTPAVDTDEHDVRSLLTKVEAGELDAGIVYVTDVLAAGDAVEGIDIPDANNVIATYPIASLTEAENGAVADGFVAFVLSDEGQQILGSYGFGPP